MATAAWRSAGRREVEEQDQREDEGDAEPDTQFQQDLKNRERAGDGDGRLRSGQWRATGRRRSGAAAEGVQQQQEEEAVEGAERGGAGRAEVRAPLGPPRRRGRRRRGGPWALVADGEAVAACGGGAACALGAQRRLALARGARGAHAPQWGPPGLRKLKCEAPKPIV